MKWLLRGIYITLLGLVLGGFFFLMFGEIPAPVTKVEKVISNDRFMGKRSQEKSS